MSCNARYFHFICMHFAVESRTNALNCASHCVCDVGAAHCVYAAWRCLMERPSSLPHQQVAGAGHANTMPWNMLESAIHGLESPFPFHFPFPAQRCVAYGKCALHSNKTHRVALLCCRVGLGVLLRVSFIFRSPAVAANLNPILSPSKSYSHCAGPQSPLGRAICSHKENDENTSFG